MPENSPESTMTEPKPTPPSPAASPSQKAAMTQLKARYMAGNAFSTVGEMKRLFLFLLITLAGIAAVVQFQWNKARNLKTVQEDNERWKRRLEAAKAGPQPGVPGGVVKWDNMLAEEKDDTSLDDVVSDRGFKYLARHIANLKPGEGMKPEERMDADTYVDILLNPASHRGNVVSLSGLLNKAFWNIRLESNQGPYDSVYRLYLVDLGGRESFIVDVLERPDGIEDRSAVEADGIFIRTHKYETIKGQTARVPYFLAQRVTKVARTKSPSIWTPAVTIGVAGACLVMVAVVFFVGRTGGPKVKNTVVSSNA